MIYSKFGSYKLFTMFQQLLLFTHCLSLFLYFSVCFILPSDNSDITIVFMLIVCFFFYVAAAVVVFQTKRIELKRKIIHLCQKFWKWSWAVQWAQMTVPWCGHWISQEGYGQPMTGAGGGQSRRWIGPKLRWRIAELGRLTPSTPSVRLILAT